MEHNSDPILSRWTDDRLASLRPHPQWRPDAARGWALLQARRGKDVQPWRHTEDPDIHLQRLLMKEDTTPIWAKVIKDIKELIHPPKLPPLQVTSKPVDPKELKGLEGLYSGNESKSVGTSVLIHVVAIALLIFISTLKPVQKMINQAVPLFAPPLEPLKVEAKGGGGGGQKQPLIHKDPLPKPSPKQFTPPTIVPQESKLMVAPTINADLPDLSTPSVGAPVGLGALMGGSGSGGGIGKGYGTGIGNGRGNGVGDGSGGGFGGGFKIGNGVTAPQVLSQVEPEYSEEARKAKFQGTVRLAIVVTERGEASQIRVITPLGLGLDQKAMEAVQKWKFKPGTKDGKPVPVQATVEVNFRLL